jgi:hypothetical protein
VNFQILFQPEAEESLNSLKNVDPKKYGKVLKTLGYMETNLRHPGLKTHKYDADEGPNGEDIFESYVENNTPGAYRVFWFYGPNPRQLTILAITPHP